MAITIHENWMNSITFHTETKKEFEHIKTNYPFPSTDNLSLEEVAVQLQSAGFEVIVNVEEV